MRRAFAQISFIISDALDARWRILWTFDAFWHLLYAAVLLTICCLWAPTKSNLQYAYMDELATEVEEAEVGEEEDAGSSSAAEGSLYTSSAGVHNQDR